MKSNCRWLRRWLLASRSIPASLWEKIVRWYSKRIHHDKSAEHRGCLCGTESLFASRHTLTICRRARDHAADKQLHFAIKANQVAHHPGVRMLV